MKMIHLEREREEDEAQEAKAVPSLPNIYLDAETLMALGINVRKLSPGDVMELQGKVRVASVSEYRYDGESPKANLSLELTDIGLGKAKTGDKAEFEAGFNDE